MVQLSTQLTSELTDRIRAEDARYQNAWQRSWDLNAARVKVEMAISYGEDVATEEKTLDELILQTVDSPDVYNNIVHDQSSEGDVATHTRAPRLANISHKLEEYARFKSTQHFLSEGKLLSPNAACFTSPSGRSVLTDEEYLGGACIGLCHELSKHSVTRASNAANDSTAVPFIKSARDSVSLILDELLEFDFRNGPLRRKYDSTKYALKNLETVLYELSVAGAVGGHQLSNGDDGGPASKKMKTDDGATTEDNDDMEEDPPSPIPKEDIKALRERMDHRDKLRETLIKTCRDGQKAAKQAIFALHRGDSERATKLLTDCENCVKNDLTPILLEEPGLRYGSFSAVLEEYVEAKLFATWLAPDEDKKPAGKILLPNEIPLPISTEDYLGGLCDLTGEVGRYAVARGTVRDRKGVELCLESNKTIYTALRMLGKIPGKNSGKKVSMVQKSVEKLERVLYEQSLMEMAGRKEFSSSVEEEGLVKDEDDN